MAEQFRLYLLGGFRLERDAQEIVLPRAKVKTLLAYLALHPQEHPREHLASLFWGDVTDDQARASLRVALNTLRKEIHSDILLTDRETVQLNPDAAVWTDAKEILDFRFQISDSNDQAISNLQSLVSLYRGDLLAGFYDEWIESERETVRAHYLELLLRVVEHYRSASDYANAILYARKILATDRANEPAHQHLIFLYAAQGDRAGALKQFEECVAALDAELGVEPSPETIALAKQINKTPIAKARAAAQTNLPKPLTSFVGREREIEELCVWLGRGKAFSEMNAARATTANENTLPLHLLTLTGPGGSGKTRLAIQAGRALLDTFPDGVWWVDFSALQDESLVAQQIAKTMGLEAQPNEPLMQTLLNALRARELLLILDNCEHLIDACAQLAQSLVSNTPISILSTSREALNIPGEQLYPVAPLDLPRAAIASFAGQALEFSAVRLFVERARLVEPRFELHERNVLPIIQICTRLDGIPLAIELAAARVKQMSANEIAARLDSRFDLLIGARTAVPRQQTLRALIDWSYNLLDAAEQNLFQQLAVFAGGWTLEALEGVIEREAFHHSITPSLHLSALVDKSLVAVDSAREETRYRLLETVREYAREKLNDTGRAEDAQTRHLAYFTNFAEQAAAHFWGRGALDAFQRVEREHDNLRAALRFALDHGDVARAAQLAGALGEFWYQRNYVDQAEHWYAQILAQPLERATPAARARLFKNAGTIAWAKADYVRAQELQERALALYREVNDTAGISVSLNKLASQLEHQGDIAQADAFHLQALDAARSVNDAATLVYALYNCGYAAMQMNDFERGQTYLTEALELAEREGDLLSMVAVAGSLGEMARLRGDWASGRPRLEQAIIAARQLDNHYLLQALLREYGSVLALLGEFSHARAALWEAWQLAQKSGNYWMIGGTFSRFAHVEAVQQHHHNAVQLWAYSFSLLANVPNAVLPPAQEQAIRGYHEGLRAALGDAAYEQARQRGRTLTQTQALALVYGDALPDEF